MLKRNIIHITDECLAKTLRLVVDNFPKNATFIRVERKANGNIELEFTANECSKVQEGAISPMWE